MNSKLALAKIGLSTAKSAFSGVQKAVKTQVKTLVPTKAPASSAVTDVIARESAEAKALFKQEFIKNSKPLSFYDSVCKKEYYAKIYPDSNVLEKIDNSRLKEFEKICAKIEKKSSSIKQGEYREEHIKYLTDLYFQDPKAYNYAINSDDLLKNFFSTFHYNFQIKYLTKPLLQEIEKGSVDPVVIEYVLDSDRFYTMPEKVDKLRKIIAERKIAAPITVCRGDLHTGMFDEIPLSDKSLIAEIKLMNRLNFLKTKEMEHTGYDLNYYRMRHHSKESVYDYIKNKENLSLADAMLVMQILSKKSQAKVLDMIKGVNLRDNRFKSTSISEKFVNYWLKVGEPDTKVIYENTQRQSARIRNRMTLQQGTEAIYVKGENGQYEFIVNDTPKNIRFTNAQYDPKNNCFILDSDVNMP